MVAERPSLRIAKFPRNAACAVTSSWDDNDAGNMGIAQILDSLNLRGTFYIDPEGKTTKQYGRGDLLSNSQLRKLAQNHEIGSHSWSHVHVRQCDMGALHKEFAESKEYLENVTCQRVYGLAYPFGEYSAEAERVARDCGYMFSRTIAEGHVEFPPSNPYLWGISVHAPGSKINLLRTLLSTRTVLSDLGRLYARNLTVDWRRLAMKLFHRAKVTRGVWHLFGHAYELRNQSVRQELLEVCRYVANRSDVWYATNAMLFQNETVKASARITTKTGTKFQVRVDRPVAIPPVSTPIPLVLEIPKSWSSMPKVKVTTTNSGRYEIGSRGGQHWLDVFDHIAWIEVTRN